MASTTYRATKGEATMMAFFRKMLGLSRFETADRDAARNLAIDATLTVDAVRQRREQVEETLFPFSGQLRFSRRKRRGRFSKPA